MITAEFSGEIRDNEPLSKHTYYQIGGPAKVLAIPKSLEDLKWISHRLFPKYDSVLILGKGSNALISDRGFDGLVIKTARMNSEVKEEDGFIRAGGGGAISSFLRKCADGGWGGLEFLTGVPGSIGGAVWMNAGTHLGETTDRIQEVEVFSLEKGELFHFKKDQLQFSYRKNNFLKPLEIVWSTLWSFEKDQPEAVKNRIDEMLKRRKSTQPIDGLSCGSVFKNPKSSGFSAWQVIEKVGLRGYSIGNAHFSEKHANFIVNSGGATAQNVKDLIELAKRKAKEELGVELEEEVRIIGF